MQTLCLTAANRVCVCVCDERTENVAVNKRTEYSFKKKKDSSSFHFYEFPCIFCCCCC